MFPLEIKSIYKIKYNKTCKYKYIVLELMKIVGFISVMVF